MSIKVRSLIGASALSVATVVGLSPAAAAPSVTAPPSVTIESFPRFVVPGEALIRDPNNPDFGWQADFRAVWTVHAPAGVCSQTVTTFGYPDTSSFPVPNDARSLDYRQVFIDNARGALQIQVDVTDCSGVTATSKLLTTTDVTGYEDTSRHWTYRGAWATTKCRCFSGGTSHNTVAAGAAATLAFSAFDGQPFALTMEKAADRGAADVYLDGVKKATVFTNSAVTHHHQVMWATVLPKGKHTIKVVNRATPGHPRIDVDAVVAEAATASIG